MAMTQLPSTMGHATAGLQETALSDDTLFDLALFMVPVLGTIQFTFMGSILLSDLLVPLLISAGLVVRGVPAQRVVYLTLAGAALWVLSLVASDIFNNTSSHNYLRGWTRNSLGCAYLVAFLCATRPTPRSLSCLIAGLAVFLGVGSLLNHRPDFAWFTKMGGGSAVAWALCVVAMWRFRAGRPLLPIAALFLWTLVAISQNVRSLMTTTFIVACLIAASYYGRSWFRRFSLPALLGILIICGAAFGSVLALSYSSLVSSGALGRVAQQKYNFQARGSTLEQIWNARPEIRVAMAAIADSPIIGNGSWYSNPQIAAAELIYSSYLGDDPDDGGKASAIANSDGHQTMGHSTILQSWVEAGILGAAFWLWVIGLCVIAILMALRRPTILSPILFMAATSLIWDSIFSPFAGNHRLSDMAELALVLVTMVAHQRAARAQQEYQQTYAPRRYVDALRVSHS